MMLVDGGLEFVPLLFLSDVEVICDFVSFDLRR